MSQQNVEMVRRVVDAVNTTGQPPLELYDPEVVFTTRGELRGRVQYEGHDGFLHALREFGEAWEHIEIEVVEVVEGANTVVAVGCFRLRAHSGVELEVEEAWAYWFRDGRILRVEQHSTRQEALDAVGLQE